MKVWKIFIMIYFLVVPTVMAQDEPAPPADGGMFGSFMDVLGEVAKGALQEQVDEMSGTYKGKLDQLRLLERRGDRLILEVTYKDVKRSDGVSVQAEVLSGGVPLDGFSNQLSQISGTEGKARLTVTQQSQDDGWGLSSAVEMESDQIRLFLIRDTRPDHPFGHLVYDLPKTWTGIDEPDLPPSQQEEDDAIELAADETLEGGQPAATGTVKPYVPGGMVLIPAKVAPVTPVVSQAATMQKAPMTSAVLSGVSSYDFFANAQKAVWKNSDGAVLTYPGRSNDKRGFVRKFATGHLSTGNAASNMLETHPQPKKKGRIEGRFPALLLGKNVYFQSTAAFLKGANASDNAVFSVYVFNDNRYTKLIRQRVKPSGYARLEGDLSPWAGKKVQLIMRVSSGPSTSQNWAVWVAPRLVQK